MTVWPRSKMASRGIGMLLVPIAIGLILAPGNYSTLGDFAVDANEPDSVWKALRLRMCSDLGPLTCLFSGRFGDIFIATFVGLGVLLVLLSFLIVKHRASYFQLAMLCFGLAVMGFLLRPLTISSM